MLANVLVACVLAAGAGDRGPGAPPAASKRLIEWGWDTSDLSKNHFPPAEFEASVRAALARSDGYVWIYTEKPRWWTAEDLPAAYVEALRKARRPEVPDNRSKRK